ncbi:MAG TPA: DUF192 domain-containing protein [Candidatus Binataceae bacterium]|nr:DUF192 domain-containing protein [Candidatus Binataceae bacterium]
MPRRIGAILGALVIALVSASCAHANTVTIAAPGGEPRGSVQVEIANTEPERQTGLMYRNHLDENAGMLFVFARPADERFWMKNTEIPLDMIFADENGKVLGVVSNARPYDESPVGVHGESQYVLEVNGGWAARHHVEHGDRLKFVDFAPHAAN